MRWVGFSWGPGGYATAWPTMAWPTIVAVMAEESARLVVASPEANVFVLSGEIDAHTAPQFAAQFEPLPAGLGSVLTIDMADVTFMDSSGLRVLIELNGRASDSGVTMTIRAPSRAVARIIEISGLSETIEVSPA
jgi:anti-sigma B factor antagonist